MGKWGDLCPVVFEAASIPLMAVLMTVSQHTFIGAYNIIMSF